jgi:hypothetical protein
MAENEPLPVPPTEEAPKVEVNQDELIELAAPKDDLVEELTSDENKKEQGAVEPDKQDKEKVSVTQSKADAPTEESPETKELKQRLAFYEMLYGDKREEPPVQQQQPQQVQQPIQQQPQQQAQRNILDGVTVTQEDLLGFLSGEPERAIPVVKKFIATAMVLTHQHMYQEAVKQERTVRYFNGIQEVFYSKDKFEDLNDYRPIVKYAGDQIQQEYAARGQFKMPHELMDEIGKRARELKDQMLGKVNGTVAKPRTIIRQGEVGDTKVTPPTKEKFINDQQKEMMDLLEH